MGQEKDALFKNVKHRADISRTLFLCLGWDHSTWYSKGVTTADRLLSFVGGYLYEEQELDLSYVWLAESDGKASMILGDAYHIESYQGVWQL